MQIETQHITTALVAIIVPLVLSWLLRSRSSAAMRSNGILWLYYGKTMKGFALFFTAIVVALVVIWFNVEPNGKMPVLGMIGLFGGLTLPLVLESFFVRIGYDAEKIYCHSSWRRNRVISWFDVESVTFSESMRWWAVETKHSGKIRISEFLSGLGGFLLELERRGEIFRYNNCYTGPMLCGMEETYR